MKFIRLTPIILALGFMFLVANQAAAQAELQIGDSTSTSIARIPVDLSVATGTDVGDLAFQVQFDPALLSFDRAIEGAAIINSNQRVTTQSIGANNVLVTVSHSNATGPINSGRLVELEFTVSQPIVSGSTALTVTQFSANDFTGSPITTSFLNGTLYLREVYADVNGDNSINTIDLQIIINNILAAMVSNTATDINGDGQVNTIDLQLNINGILGIPVIQKSAPNPVVPGEVVDIFGVNFGASSATTMVDIDGLSATINSITDGQINVTVPAAATNGVITVVNAGGQSGVSSVALSQPADPAQSTVTLSAIGTLIANGMDTAELRVVLRDASGQLLENQRCQISLSNGTLVAQNLVSNRFGEVRGLVSSTIAGTAQATVLVGQTNQVQLNDMPSVLFGSQLPADAQQSDLAVNLNSIAADGVTTASVSATIRDVNGVPLINQSVQFLVSGPGQLQSAMAMTNSAGVATVDILSNVAGTSIVSAVVDPAQSNIAIADTASINFTAPTITNLQVNPNSLSIALGQSQVVQVNAEVNAQSIDVTSGASYQSSDPNIITVRNGQIFTLAAGSANVTIVYGSLQVVLPVTVTTATIQSIAIVPNVLATNVGVSQSLSVLATNSDGSISDVTSGAQISSSDTAIAVINGANVLGIAPGSATLTAQFSGFSALQQVTVTQAVLLESSPENGDSEVGRTRETILNFSTPIAMTSVNANSIKAEFAGQSLALRYHFSPDRRRVTLFYNDPLPASARVRVTLDGALLTDDAGQNIDVDRDGSPGGTKIIEFDTVTATSVPGTAICGRIFASEPTNVNGQAQSVDLPLAGVTITVDGSNPVISTTTDMLGNFRLDDVPVGRFFVHVDGRTATVNVPAGAYYPNVGKPYTSVAGKETNIGNVFLPLIEPQTLTAVSQTTDTEIDFPASVLSEFPQFAGTRITVPADSLFSDDGTPGGMVGIAPVAPNRLPGALPSFLNFSLIITVQTNGPTNFDTPAPITFPNVDNLPPGSKTALWSFNHDTGRFEIVGTMTVDPTGQFVSTDPGVGIQAPGWHGTMPGTVVEGGALETDDAGSDREDEPGTDSDPSADPNSGDDDCPGSEGSVGAPPEGKALTDPVHYFSGEFYLEETDLRIKGRGLDFIWTRKYRHQIGKNTPQGNKWDHSYNIFIEQDGQDVVLHDGNNRADKYFRQVNPSGPDIFTRSEFFRELTEDPGGTYTLEFEDTGFWRFKAFDGTPSAGKLLVIQDRNGNALNLSYDANGRLDAIVDTLNRTIQINYNAAGMIASVVDFSGRVVQYQYYDGVQAGGSAGDLRSVTSPAVVNTPNGNDFPNGKTRSYTYTAGFADARLNSNLLTMTDGRRNDPNDPTNNAGPYLINEYSASTDPADVNFNRVLRQTWGGGIVDLRYFEIRPSLANFNAATKVIINDREGHVTERFYDNQNRLVVDRRYNGLATANAPTTQTSNRPGAPLRNSDPEFYQTLTTYTEDSLVRSVIYPNGNSTEYVYEGDLNPLGSPRLRASVREIRHLTGTHSTPGNQSQIIEQFEYAAEFGGCCGFNFVTKYTDGRGGEVQFRYDPISGNRLQKIERISGIITDYEYNNFGQLTRVTQPDNGTGFRRIDEFIYYAGGPQNGFLQQQIIDSGQFNLTTTYEYDLRGNVTRETDPRGNSKQMVINELDQVQQFLSREVTNNSNIRYRKDLFYDANNNLVRVDLEDRDENGALRSNAFLTTTFEYDILNFLIKETREVSATESLSYEYEYDLNRNMTLIRSAEAVNGNQVNNTVRKTYDARDLLYQFVRAENSADKSTDQLDYDGNKNIVRISRGIESNPRITERLFDPFNRMVQLTDPLGNVLTIDYDANSNQTRRLIQGELFDVAGSSNNITLREITATYDAMNRPLTRDISHFDIENQTQIGDGFGSTTFTYSDLSQITSITDDNNNTSTYTHDTANRVTLVTDAKQNTRQYTYDNNGNVVALTEVDKSDLGQPDQTFVTTYVYDNLDRNIQRIDNVGNVTDYFFDARGNLTLTSDATRTQANQSGNLIRYFYDGINRLIQTDYLLTDDGTGQGNVVDTISVLQSWDGNSRLVSRTDGEGNQTTWAYDDLDRATQKTYADGTVCAMTWDVHNNMITKTDPNGSVQSNQYDLLDRLTNRTITRASGVLGTTFENYDFDGLSRIMRAEDDDSIVERRFDSRSTLLSETIDGVASLFVHDAMGNLTQSVYPGGRVVNRGYDSLNRVSNISDSGGSIAQFSWIGTERVEQIAFGNSTRLNKSYDGAKRVISTIHQDGMQQAFDSRTYTWDGMYNKLSRTDNLTNTTHTYSYDSIYRLASINTTGANPGMELFDLDKVHNRETVTGGPNPGSYIANAMSPVNDAQVNQYTTTPFDARNYDNNGNLTAVTQTTTDQYQYDFKNQLVGINFANGDSSQYRYDCFGRRLARTVTISATTQSTLYYYFGWRVIEERDSNQLVLATYTHGSYIDEILSMQRGASDFYYHCDDLFNVMKITDSAGFVVEQYDYGSFGEPQIFDAAGNPLAQSAIDNLLTFNAHRLDPESGLLYYRRRYMDPKAGRFITRDPIGIWGDRSNLGNGYTYAANNPWTFVDPLGEWSFGFSAFIGIGGGANVQWNDDGIYVCAEVGVGVGGGAEVDVFNNDEVDEGAYVGAEATASAGVAEVGVEAKYDGDAVSVGANANVAGIAEAGIETSIDGDGNVSVEAEADIANTVGVKYESSEKTVEGQDKSSRESSLEIECKNTAAENAKDKINDAANELLEGSDDDKKKSKKDKKKKKKKKKRRKKKKKKKKLPKGKIGAEAKATVGGCKKVW